MKDPLWAAITSHNGCEERFSQSLVKALQELHDMCDNSKNNFFLTMLITSLLSNHLSWLTSISSPTSQAPSPSSPSSPILTLESPHKEYANGTIAHQLDTLNGSFGKCTKATRLIIVGSDEPLIKALLFVLTYFIRGHDLTAVSRQPCSPTCLYSNRSIEHLCSLSPSSLPHPITTTTATPTSTSQETSGTTYKGLKTCELSANCKLDVVLMPDNGGEDHLSNGHQKAESNNTNGNSNRGRSSSVSAAKTKHLQDASCSCLFRSLCAAYSKLGYSSDFTMLGFAATKNEEAHAIASSAQIAKADANSMDHHSWFPALVDDLRSQVAHPLLPSSQTRATVRSSSCIIADTNSWTCNLVTYNPWNLTRQPFKWKGREYRGVFVDTVAHSQFLHSVMWTISEFHKTGLSSEACLLYVEDKLQELYAHSNVLLEFIGSQQLPETSSAPSASASGSMSGAPPMVTLSDMSTALGFGLGDLILLLSIACTKNPSIVDALHPVDILREGTLNNILPVS
ncbi:Folliculin-interacting protein 1 [Balamuthia mandrillaris]